jgi:hypothetical protein
MAEIFKLIDGVKKLVEWFKHSNMQCKLEKTLKQENATRWNSMLRSLVSVYDMYSEVTDILEDKNKLDKLQDIPKKLLTDLINFLNRFQQATESLEQFKQPSLHKVVYWQLLIVFARPCVLAAACCRSGGCCLFPAAVVAAAVAAAGWLLWRRLLFPAAGVAGVAVAAVAAAG